MLAPSPGPVLAPVLALAPATGALARAAPTKTRLTNHTSLRLASWNRPTMAVKEAPATAANTLAMTIMRLATRTRNDVDASGGTVSVRTRSVLRAKRPISGRISSAADFSIGRGFSFLILGSRHHRRFLDDCFSATARNCSFYSFSFLLTTERP